MQSFLLLLAVLGALQSAANAQCEPTQWSNWSDCRVDNQKVRTRECSDNQVDYSTCTADACAFLTASYNGTVPPLISNFFLEIPPLDETGNFTEDIFAQVVFNGTKLIATIFVLADEPFPPDTNVHTVVALTAFFDFDTCFNGTQSHDTVQNQVELNDPNGTTLVHSYTFEDCPNITFALAVRTVHNINNSYNEVLLLHMNATSVLSKDNFTECNTLDTSACCDNCTTTEWSQWSPCSPSDSQQVRTRFDNCTFHIVEYRPCAPVCAEITAQYNGTLPPELTNFAMFQTAGAFSFTGQVFASVSFNDTKLQATVSIFSGAPLPPDIVFVGNSVGLAAYPNCSTNDSLNQTAFGQVTIGDPNGETIVYPWKFTSCDDIYFSLRVTIEHANLTTGNHLFLALVINTTSEGGVCNVLDISSCCENCEPTQWSAWSDCRVDNQKVRTRVDTCGGSQVDYSSCTADACAFLTASYDGAVPPPLISNFFLDSPLVNQTGSFTEDIFAQVIFNETHLIATVFVLADEPLPPYTYISTGVVLTAFENLGNCANGNSLNGAAQTQVALNDPNGATLVYPYVFEDCPNITFTLVMQTIHNVSVNKVLRLRMNATSLPGDTQTCNTLDTSACCDNCTTTEWSDWSPCSLSSSQQVRTRTTTCEPPVEQVDYQSCIPDAVCANLTASYNGETTPPNITNFFAVINPDEPLPGNFTEQVFASVSFNGTHLESTITILSNLPLPPAVVFDGADILLLVFDNCSVQLPIATAQGSLDELNIAEGLTLIADATFDPCSNLSFSLFIIITHKVSGNTSELLLRLEGPNATDNQCNTLDTSACCDNCTTTEWSEWSACGEGNKQVRTRIVCDPTPTNEFQYRKCVPDAVCANVTASYNGATYNDTAPEIDNFRVSHPAFHTLPASFTEQILANVSFNGTHLEATVFVLADAPLLPGVVYNGTKVGFVGFVNDHAVGSAEGSLPLLNDANGLTLTIPKVLDGCDEISFALGIQVNHIVNDTANGTAEYLLLHVATEEKNHLDTSRCCNCVRTWGYWKRNYDERECYDPLVCGHPADFWFIKKPKGDVFILLVHQYLAAYFNVNCSGALPDAADQTLILGAEAYLDAHCYDPVQKGDAAYRQGAILAIKLTKFNEGKRSVPACKGTCDKKCKQDDDDDREWLSGIDGEESGARMIALYSAIALACVTVLVAGVVMKRKCAVPSDERIPLLDEEEQAIRYG